MNFAISSTNRFKLGTVGLLISSFLASCSSDSFSSGEAQESMAATRLMLPMSDGTALVTYYRLPSGDGPFPTIVVRSPYELPHTPLSGIQDIDYTSIPEEEFADVGWPEITDAGYALVIQHTRGRVGSEGIFEFTNERSDGVDLIEWVDAQDWSNGKVGVAGDSVEAIEAMMMSSESPELVDATFAQIGTPDLINGSLKGPGGALKLETFFLWGADLVLTAADNHYEALGYLPEEQDELRAQMLPIVIEAASEPVNAHTVDVWYPPMLNYPYFAEASPSWNEILTATPDSEFSATFNSKITSVPSFYVAAWHDVFASSQISSFAEGEMTNGEQRLLILNGTHFTPEDPGAWPIQPLLPWFDYQLKGETSELLSMPRVIFPIANENDEWYGATTWPPVSSVSEVWKLSSDGGIISPSQDGLPDGARSFSYDPEDPVPTVGGKNLNIVSGTLDQQTVRGNVRDDVLSYDSAPLAEDLIIAGKVTSSVTLSSDVPDTDITVKLMDLSPDGTATLVTEGIQRTRFRDGLSQEILMSSGEVYELNIDIGQIAWRFKQGHSIAVDISSSNFPQWDRNMNTGLPLYQSTEGSIATNTIYHGNVASTTIMLPVISDITQLENLENLNTGISE